MRGIPGSLIVFLILLVLCSACDDSPTVAVDPCETVPANDVFRCVKDRINGPGDPCRFLTTSIAERVIGRTLAAPGRTDAGKCFNVVDPSGVLEFQVTRGPQARSAFDDATARLSDQVEGMWDSAVWEASASTLHVMEGDAYLWVKLEGVPDNRALTSKLARLALLRVVRESSRSPSG